MGIIYLLKTREFSNTNVFKIGRSSKPGATRTNEYPRGSVLYLLVTVNNEKIIERKIIDCFSIDFIHKKEYGTEYFEGNYMEMMEKIFKIITENNQVIEIDEMLTSSDEDEEQIESICELKKSTEKYRTHYIKFKSGLEFLCETQNGFVQILIDKNILEVNKEFDISDNKLIKKVTKEKNKLHIENFDIFCSMYGKNCNSSKIENFFDDTIINGLFYGLSINEFNKSKFKNFEKRDYHIAIDQKQFTEFHKQNISYEQYNDIYTGYTCYTCSYTNITIICINNKLFCDSILYKYIPKRIEINSHNYVYIAREYDYIDLDSKTIQDFKPDFYEELYESGKNPWNGIKLYNAYIEKIRTIRNKYNLFEKDCLNPHNNVFLTFIN